MFYVTCAFKNESQISEYTRLIRSIRNAENRKPVWNRDVKFNFKSGGILQPPMAGADQTVPMYAMGGSLPGSVGFTYARTAGAAPSEGPYAKKTLPSAQNGAKIPVIEDEGSFNKDGIWIPDWDKMTAQDEPQSIDTATQVWMCQQARGRQVLQPRSGQMVWQV